MTQVAFRAGEKLEKQPEKRKILEMATYFPDTPEVGKKQVITVVSRRREIRRCTPEKGKTSHYSGESPPRD